MEITDFTHNGLNFKATLFPGDSNSGNVLIAPAMGITAKYYIQFASWLNEQGFTVMILDYTGTGLSNIDKISNSKVTLKDWVKNIEVAGQELKSRAPSIPLIFLGHSIGSQLFGFIEDVKLFDKSVFIASSTGYWNDGHSPQKWINLFLLMIVIPFSNLIWGYTNAKFFKQGENYPKKPSLQWRKWCLNKDYLKIDFNVNQENNFNNYKGKITSIWFTDDPVANKKTVPKLVNIFKQAETSLLKLAPIDINTNKIGHAGFLSRKYKENLWPKLHEQLI